MGTQNKKHTTLPKEKFGPIYESFDHLLKQKLGILKYFRKSRNPDILKQVWKARQGEVDSIINYLYKCEKELFTIKTAKKLDQLKKQSLQRAQFETFFKQESQVKIQKEKVKNLEEENAHLKKVILKNKFYKSEFERIQKLTATLELAVAHKGAELNQERKDFEASQQNVQISHIALIKLNEEMEALKQEIFLSQKKYRDLEKELEKIQGQNKSYKRLNHNMQNELYRVSEELERGNTHLN